jgi:hypothetical protein
MNCQKKNENISWDSQYFFQDLNWAHLIQLAQQKNGNFDKFYWSA